MGRELARVSSSSISSFIVTLRYSSKLFGYHHGKERKRFGSCQTNSLYTLPAKSTHDNTTPCHQIKTKQQRTSNVPINQNKPQSDSRTLTNIRQPMIRSRTSHQCMKRDQMARGAPSSKGEILLREATRIRLLRDRLRLARSRHPLYCRHNAYSISPPSENNSDIDGYRTKTS